MGGDLEGTVTEVWYRGTHTDYAVMTDQGPLGVRLSGPPVHAVGDRRGWEITRRWPSSI